MGVVVRGAAKDEKELFEFENKPVRNNITGTGVGPTVERAKEIAETSAAKLLHGAVVVWVDGLA
jgi:hypothetical protein